MAVCLAAGGVFTRHTTYGYEIYAIGANAEAARLSGIPVRARLNLAYTLSGAMAGLAAVVYLARLNSAEADIGEPLMLPAIAAVLIGGTSLFGGLGSLSGTLDRRGPPHPRPQRHEPAEHQRQLAAAGHRRDRARRRVDRYRYPSANRGDRLSVPQS